MRLVQLNKDNLESAIALGRSVFNYEGYDKKVEKNLRFVTNQQYFERSLRSSKKGSDKYNKAKKELKYFRRVNSPIWLFEDYEHDILGFTGLAWRKNESNVWLNWTCVDTEVRGKGLGARLLDYAIMQAKRRNFNELGLWTSTLPQEADAQILYESRNIEIYDRERVRKSKIREKSYTRLYRKLKL